MSSKYFSSDAEMWSYLLISKGKIKQLGVVLSFSDELKVIVYDNNQEEYGLYVDWKIAEPYKEKIETIFFRRKWVLIDQMNDPIQAEPLWFRTICEFDAYYNDVIDKSDEIEERSFELRSHSNVYKDGKR